MLDKFEFKFGQFVASTPLAIERGLFRRQMFGVVVHQDNLFGVRVHIKGRKLSSGYAADFWRPLYATRRKGKGK